MLRFLQQEHAAKLTTQTSTNEHFAETVYWNSIIKWKSQAYSNLA